MASARNENEEGEGEKQEEEITGEVTTRNQVFWKSFRTSLSLEDICLNTADNIQSRFY